MEQLTNFEKRETDIPITKEMIEYKKVSGECFEKEANMYEKKALMFEKEALKIEKETDKIDKQNFGKKLEIGIKIVGLISIMIVSIFGGKQIINNLNGENINNNNEDSEEEQN